MNCAYAARLAELDEDDECVRSGDEIDMVATVILSVGLSPSTHRDDQDKSEQD